MDPTLRSLRNPLMALNYLHLKVKWLFFKILWYLKKIMYFEERLSLSKLETKTFTQFDVETFQMFGWTLKYFRGKNKKLQTALNGLHLLFLTPPPPWRVHSKVALTSGESVSCVKTQRGFCVAASSHHWWSRTVDSSAEQIWSQIKCARKGSSYDINVYCVIAKNCLM